MVTRWVRRASALALVALSFSSTSIRSPAARADIVPGASRITGSPPTPLVEAQPPDSLPGIDVSHWQQTIDWTQVAASGVRFVIAKATEGQTYIDPMYGTNKLGAMSAGLAFSAYHFARPDDTPGDAIAEADHFVDVAQLAPGNLIPALDIERTGTLTQTQLTQWILDWLGRVTERMGVRPMVYTSPHGWENRTGDTTAVAAAGYTVLWLANWDVATPTVPAVNWNGNGWRIWQWTNCTSVPGITGCVDADWHAGTTFDDITIPGPDLVAPTATITVPGELGRPVVVSFSEGVRGVNLGNVVLWQPDSAAPVPSTLTCFSRRDTKVGCATGPVRRASLQPDEPLVAGQSYSVLVDPAGVPAIVDVGGNPVATVQQDFTAPTQVEEDSGGVTFSWRSVGNRRAYGRSYAVEHLGGARFSMAFHGRSITWYTATGPAQGRAAVEIDGRSRGVFDQYAPRPDFRVPRTFKKLDSGWHTITIRALGKHARSASDSQVVIDAFGTGGAVVANPMGTWTWRRMGVSHASGGHVATADGARAAGVFLFRGTGVRWYTVRGPDQGRAAIYVDGALARTVDNYAPSVEADVVRSTTGLADGVHTLRIVVLGKARPKADAALVAIDRLVVVP
jgi:GH25 family lysozyme M1 (1,4-beta-N-acetylmuramidase)